MVVVSRPLDLGNAVCRKIGLVAPGKPPHGKEDIQHGGIAEHHHRLKHPEEPLMLEHRADLVGVGDVQTRRDEVLHGAVDGADHDERAAGVQHVQGSLDFLVQHPSPGAVVMEPAGQGHEPHHQRDLQKQGRLQQRLSCVLLALRIGRVGDQGSPISGQHLDHHPHCDEGGEYPARVDGRVVRDVVQDAPEEEVVGGLINGAKLWLARSSE